MLNYSTHTHPWGGEDSPPPRENGRGGTTQRREVLASSLFSFLTPSPSIYKPGSPAFPRENTPCTLGNTFRTNEQAPRGRRSRGGSKVVQPIQGFGRTPGGPPRGVFHRGSWHVGPYGSSRCTRCFEAVWTGCGPLNPCAAHVAAPDSSGLSLLDW